MDSASHKNSGIKKAEKAFEKTQSRQDDGERRSFNPTRQISDISSGIEKLEGRLADQEKQWNAIVSLRGRWGEATRIQRAIVAAIHEQGNVEKEVESLKAVEKNIEGKDRREQKKVLWSEKEVLRKYEDMQALVQRSERDFQGQWLTEQSRLV